MNQERKNFEGVNESYHNKISGGSQEQEIEIDLRAILDTLYVNRHIIIITALCGLLFGIATVIQKVPQYSSNVLFRIESQQGGFGKTPFFNMNVGQSEQDVQTVLIKSRYILEPVVQALGLDLTVSQDYFPVFGEWYARHHSKRLAKPFLGFSQYSWGGEKLKINQFIVPEMEENQTFSLIVGPTNQEYSLYDKDQHLILRGKVGDQIQKFVPNRGLFNLSVTELDANPGMRFHIYKRSTQSMISSLAMQIKITDLGTEVGGAASETGVLEMSLTGADPQFIVSILNEIAKVSVEKNIEKKSAEAAKILAFLNQQIPLVRQSLDEAGDKLNRYQAQKGKIDLSIQSKVLLNELISTQRTIEEIKLRKAELLQKYTLEHPFILALNDQEKILQDESQSLESRLVKLPIEDQQAVSLMRDMRVKGGLYMILLNNAQSLKVTKAGTVSDLQILGWAQLPDGPLSTSKFLLMLGGIIGGGLLGVLLVIARSFLYRKISDPNVIESKFALSTMAIIPYSEKQQELIVAYSPKKTLIPLLAKDFPKELSIEALRSFRTSLKFAMIDAPNNIITIAGVVPSVGKSFVSANFAYLLADVGKKVLLIDGDLRKGHLKDYFKIGPCKGLSDVIVGNCSFDTAVIKSFQDLDFLAAGAYPPNPSELLMSHHFKDLLDQASKQYDWVIIDTAPILAVTDAAVIGQYAGANFLVLASDMHEAAEVELALKRFDTNKVFINGMIFNFSKRQKNLYRHGYAYKYEKYQYKYE